MKFFINTKERLRERIEYDRSVFEENAMQDIRHSSAYYHAVMRLIDQFLKELDDMILFKKLEPGWEYFVSYSYQGIDLFLQHFPHEDAAPDQQFHIYSIPAQFLTVEEYAHIYDVGVGTVRQWIRRGKLRTVRKSGNEWRVSELSDPPKRGYTPGIYHLGGYLSDLPDEYRYLKGADSVYLEHEGAGFLVTLHKEGRTETKEITLEDGEKLERFLISSSEATYIENLFESLNGDLVRG